uniref:Uncharacterized protein n=1 Tax=uncultured prokaryote TaxID=198431 RepID=A0A0H5Q8D8_9ZZZZ|nr:hypothetical protein [uncultured prokaryote]
MRVSQEVLQHIGDYDDVRGQLSKEHCTVCEAECWTVRMEVGVWSGKRVVYRTAGIMKHSTKTAAPVILKRATDVVVDAWIRAAVHEHFLEHQPTLWADAEVE